MTNPLTPVYLTIDDVLILLVVMFLISFIAYILSHVSSGLVGLFEGLTKRLKPKFDYNSTKDFEKYKSSPQYKEVKKRNGVRLPFSLKR